MVVPRRIMCIHGCQWSRTWCSYAVIKLMQMSIKKNTSTEMSIKSSKTFDIQLLRCIYRLSINDVDLYVFLVVYASKPQKRQLQEEEKRLDVNALYALGPQFHRVCNSYSNKLTLCFMFQGTWIERCLLSESSVGL